MANPADTIISISPVEFGRLQLFKGVSIYDVEDILSECPLLRIDEGAVVVAPEQRNERLYVVLRGSMRVNLASVESEPVTKLSAGDVFGELSVIDFGPTSAYVIADSPCRLLGIDKDAFWEMFRRCPEVGKNLLTILAKRIRNTNQQLKGSQASLMACA